MKYVNVEDGEDEIDVEFSELCSDTLGGSFEYDPFGDDESSWIQGDRVRTQITV